MRLNLRQIEAFRYVFQTGNMTLAGELMGVTQPAISRLIRDLEAEIGFRLFDRVKGGLSATAYAQEFYREVQRSFHGLDKLARVAKEIKNHNVGELKIAATVATTFYLLPKVIEEFRKDWPDIKVSMHAGTSPEVLEGVATRQFDIGIAIVPPEAAGIRVIELPFLNSVCVLPANHRLADKDIINPKDLSGEPLMTISEYSVTQRRVFRSFEEVGAELNVVLESSFSAPICDLVGRELGVSVLEPMTALAYESDKVAVRRYEPAIPVELKAVHSPAHPVSEAGEAFIEILKRQLTAIRENYPGI